ncbi:MAG: AAA family ATPase [Pyrinomonadaceae bacterium]
MSTTVEEVEKTKKGEDKKSELLLDSLEIKGYRCFEHLTIDKLGQVNLIVGKNNVGKTALLETLWIYANHDEPDILHKIIFDRNEITNEKNMSHESLREYNFALRNIFYNRPTIPNRDHKRKESLYFIISKKGHRWEYLEDKVLTSDAYELNLDTNQFDEFIFDSAGSEITFVRYFYSSQFGMPYIEYIPRITRDINNLFINAVGLRNEILVEFWDKITLTPLEDKVIEALHILLPKLIRIEFIGYPNGSKIRVPIVRVRGEKERIPLKSFGEGMTRLLGLSLAFVQCQNGMLFIDEIESGLHYSVLPDVWKLIFKTAKELNVQVFATTHSYDCIEAFAQAAIDDEKSEGNLIRLAQKDDQIKAFTFDEKQLETITKERIEVR